MGGQHADLSAPSEVTAPPSGRSALTSPPEGGSAFCAPFAPADDFPEESPPVPPLPFAADSRWMAMDTLPPPAMPLPLPPTDVEGLGGGGIDLARSRSLTFQTLALARVVSLEDLEGARTHSRKEVAKQLYFFAVSGGCFEVELGGYSVGGLAGDGRAD